MRKLIVLLSIFMAFGGCNDGDPNGKKVYIPDVPVNITLNLDLPSNMHLNNLGGFSLLTGGHRGIFLVHHFDDAFYAVERTCTYIPDSACAVIQVDTSNIQLRCGTYNTQGYDQCCQSLFSYDGSLLQGPAQYSLKRYNVSRNGNLLSIYN
ncbi:MAG: hypothetical protein H6607_07755 [Flavobacteriales bacterium]|nr:hypothetical protein [Flavobacteriales bacterium]